jgi:DNA polymerase III subunit gamma/tau
MKDGVRGDPLVQAVLERFPGAEIVDVRAPGPTSEPTSEMPPLDSDVAGDDTL